MSNYYKYNFVSPAPEYAIVKEELKSYFDTGAVDDLLFPVYLDKCLRKLGKSGYNIVEEILYLEDFQTRLPDNFYAVREAWLCTASEGTPYQNPNSFYSQAASTATIQVSPVISGGNPCSNTDCADPNCNGLDCMPVLTQAVYKTNNSTNSSFTKQYLLKPGNISVKAQCTLECANFGSSSADSFDIRDNKFTTNFRTGTVYLVYYATDYDSDSNQMIPDNFRIREYIEAFLKYKVFETITNQVSDETFNQLLEKLRRYELKADEAYIMAEMEIKKQDAYTKQRRIKQQMNSFQMYELPPKNVISGWNKNRS